MLLGVGQRGQGVLEVQGIVMAFFAGAVRVLWLLQRPDTVSDSVPQIRHRIPQKRLLVLLVLLDSPSAAREQAQVVLVVFDVFWEAQGYLGGGIDARAAVVVIYVSPASALDISKDWRIRWLIPLAIHSGETDFAA